MGMNRPYKVSAAMPGAAGGNILLLSIILVMGCSAPRKSQDRTISDRRPFPEKIESPREKPAPPAEPVDTIRWTVVDTLSSRPARDRTPPSRIETEKPSPPLAPGEDMSRHYKDVYRLAVLLPFMAGDSLLNPGNRTAAWATDFYMGFKIALQEWPAHKAGFKVDVFDTKGADQRIEQLIRDGNLAQYDVLVGPYRNQHASLLADFVKDKPVLLFSPYSASTRIGADNTHYLQVNPGLETHLSTIFRDVADRFADGDHVVFLFGEGDTELFKKNLWDSLLNTLPLRLRSGWETRRIPGSDIQLTSILIDSLLPGDGQHIVVLPSWEETVVMGLLRKLAAERLEKKVRVYGLPQWITFDRLDPAHLEALQVHVSSADHFDPRDPDIQELGKKFRESFGQPLNTDVVWGYRSGRFLTQTLAREGALFQRFFPLEPVRTHASDLGFVRVFSEENGRYRSENRRVQVLRFERGAFSPAR